MNIPMDDWECEFGPYHILDEKEISIEIATGVVTFHCANCQKGIAKKHILRCPKETRYHMFQLALSLGGNGESLEA